MNPKRKVSSKLPCRDLRSVRYLDENCGIGRESKLCDLKYIIDPILPCDTLKSPCQQHENCVEKSCLRFIFPTLVCCRETALIIQCLFALFATFTIVNSYAPAFWFTNEVDKNFIDKEIEQNAFMSNLRTISNISEFWKFLDVSFLNNRYWIQWLTKNQTRFNNSADSYLLGVPRLRQVRSGIDESELSAHCLEVEKEILMETAKTICGDIVDLRWDRKDTTQTINNLKSSSWINNATKSLYLTFTIFNSNINYFCIVKAAFDHPITGGMIAYRFIYTVRLLPYINIFDHIILGCQIFFIIALIYFTILEIIKIFICKGYYWVNCWNYITLLHLCLAIACVIMHIISLGWAKRIIESQRNMPDEHVDFTRIGEYVVKIHTLAGILLFLIWFKIFQYIRYISPMNILNITLARNKQILCGFFMNFWVIFIAFSLSGYLLFGSQVNGFSKFEYSLYALLKALMGEFIFEEIRFVNGYWAYIFFTVFIFIVFLLLMNLFFGIIYQSYIDAMKYEENKDRTCRPYCLRCKSKCMGCFRKKKKKTTNIIKLLKTCSYTDEEICEAFKVYDLDPCMDVSKHRVNQFLNELLTHKYHFYEAANYVRENHANKIYITLDEYELYEAEISRLARNIEMLCCRINAKSGLI